MCKDYANTMQILATFSIYYLTALVRSTLCINFNAAQKISCILKSFDYNFRHLVQQGLVRLVGSLKRFYSDF